MTLFKLLASTIFTTAATLTAAFFPASAIIPALAITIAIFTS